MIYFYATPRRTRATQRVLTFKGASELVKMDWSSWAEDNGAVTSVTWTLVAGNASVASTSLASNVAQAQVTTATEGWSLLKLTATSGSDIDIQYIELLAKDPMRDIDDYV